MQSRRATTPPTRVEKFKRLRNFPPPSCTHLEPGLHHQDKLSPLRDLAPSAEFKPCPLRNHPVRLRYPIYLSFENLLQNPNPAHLRALSPPQCSTPPASHPLERLKVLSMPPGDWGNPGSTSTCGARPARGCSLAHFRIPARPPAHAAGASARWVPAVRPRSPRRRARGPGSATPATGRPTAAGIPPQRRDLLEAGDGQGVAAAPKAPNLPTSLHAYRRRRSTPPCPPLAPAPGHPESPAPPPAARTAP